jgi:Arc/MetJ-type ribon-helix-helix transcriptional regulator
MPRFSRDPLQKMISLRLTQDQDRLLGELAASLGLLGGKAELLRKALDYWLEYAPEAQEAQEAAKKAVPKEEEGLKG